MSYLGILDLDENPLSSFNFALHFLEAKEFDIKVVCRTGVHLRSVDGENVFYYARFDSGDSWTALSPTGLDLSPFSGVMKVVHIKVETDENTSAKQQATTLFVQ